MKIQYKVGALRHLNDSPHLYLEIKIVLPKKTYRSNLDLHLPIRFAQFLLLFFTCAHVRPKRDSRKNVSIQIFCSKTLNF